MDERAALSVLADRLPHAGDDAAVVDEQVLTTDMLHETTDFPEGTTRYTAGWRSVGASLSDVAAMGAEATAAVAVYAAPEFEDADLAEFVTGASDVCEAVGAEYVGGDLDESEEFTTATTALGRTDDPVRRSGTSPGDVVCVTGTLGRTGAALGLFRRGATESDDAESDDVERANDLFRFEPRVAAARAIAPHATAMMDSSDGLARSLHQLAEASDCGFSISWDSVPVDEAVREIFDTEKAVRERSVFFGEDFELVFTVSEADLSAIWDCSPTPISVIGDVTPSGVEMDGDELPDRGYTHGED
jgi:thiamine-monophosphate kinase